MNCPGCGAAMQVVGNRQHFHCDYCGASHFPEETNEGVALLGEKSTRSCPVCSVPMGKAQIEGEEIRYCEKCRGFLATNDTFGRIVNKRRALHGPNEQITEPFDPAELKRQLRCPSCGGRMEAHPYFGGGNTVVDTCECCHMIWLDAGELAIIERYIPHVTCLDPVAPITDESLPENALLT
jgi:Zn-finger nucleic acid-binding protein